MRIATLHVGHHALWLYFSLTILGDDDVINNNVLQRGPTLSVDQELTMRVVFRKTPGLAKWRNKVL